MVAVDLNLLQGHGVDLDLKSRKNDFFGRTMAGARWKVREKRLGARGAREYL